MYGRDATLPIEFVIPTLQAQLPEKDQQDDLLKRVQRLTGKTDEDRLVVQDRIYKEQQKQKELHDSSLREIKFKIGELVLLYKSHLREKQKLEERWKGPYRIHEVLGNGAYKIRTLDEKILKTPVNSERLKRYHQRHLNDQQQ